jgi:hypothetical protein
VLKAVIKAGAANSRFLRLLVIGAVCSEGLQEAVFTRCCMMQGCLLSFASQKPSTTDQVLNGVYGTGNRGEMGMFQ